MQGMIPMTRCAVNSAKSIPWRKDRRCTEIVVQGHLIDYLTAAFISLLDTMMTLGGSPMAVAVPPILENTTSAIRTGRGSRFNT